jgi:hypothetical protein
MPIQIIDNFDLNSGKPIDNRFVVGSQSFYPTKDSITYKYPGMRVWDLNDGIPYVWTGTTFSSENSVSISGNGTANYITKYLSTSIVGNSIIYDNGTNVGISNPTPAYKLDVNGDVRSQGSNGFYGVGSNLTALNATNVTLGNLSLSRITNGTSGQLLVAGASQPEWRNASLITVGTASAVAIIDDTATSTTMYPTFSINSSGTSALRVSSTKLQFNPGAGTLTVQGSLILGAFANKATIAYGVNVARTLTIPSLSGNSTFAFLQQAQSFTAIQTFTSVTRFSNGTNLSPSLAFSSETDTGIYRSASNNIDFTIDGSRSINFWRNAPNATEIRFFNGVTQMGAIVSWHGTNYATLDWNFIHVGHTTTALAANCYITNEGDGTGRIYRSTSSLKYKKDIENLDVDLENYKKLRPVRYKSKIVEDDDRSFIGFIAEEIDELGYHEFVNYDKDGNPDGLGYGNFTSLNTAVIQKLLKRVEELEKKVG